MDVDSPRVRDNLIVMRAELFETHHAGTVTYWNRRLVEGKGRPPKVKASDSEVIAFVASKPGGIGYVSATIELPPGVRVLEVID